MYPFLERAWIADMKTEEYARWFRASTPYISAHRGRTFVVALSGEAMLHGNLVNIVHDLALLNVLGARLVVVHGARPQIDRELPDSAFHSHQGIVRRITDAQAMHLIAGIHGQLRAGLEALFSTGLPTSPLHNTEVQIVTGNFVTAKPIGVIDGVDLELAGQPRRIRAGAIHRSLDTGAIVLLSPVGYSPSGQAFNLAADELAERAAIALEADKLIVLDESPFLAGTNGERLANLSPAELDEVLAARGQGTASHGGGSEGRAKSRVRLAGREKREYPADVSETTRRNLRALLGAVRGGVASGQMVSYADDGALLAELFTAEGIGTQITTEDRRVVRRAGAGDVAGIVEIVRPLEEAGILVERSRDRLERELDRFLVAEVDGIVAGCCSLLPAGSGAELACVAVHPAHRGGEAGIGARLLAAAEDAARAEGFDRLFVLTTQTRDWFIENGFTEAARGVLPESFGAHDCLERNAKVLVKALEPLAAPSMRERQHG